MYLARTMTGCRGLAVAVLVLLAAWLAQAADETPAPAPTTAPAPIDWEKARALYQRERAGQQLSAGEQAYLGRAKAERQKGGGRPAGGGERGGAGAAGGGEGAPGGGAGKETTGLKPLTEMGAADRYKGEDGGLYGGGQNAPPAAHLQAALAAAARVVPRDAAGQPAADGKVVLISVGMSNTTQEFSAFVPRARQDAALNPRLVLVDGAQGGTDSQAWAVPQGHNKRDRPEPWLGLTQRLTAAGVTPAQVQVAWLKQARKQPAQLGDYPAHAKAMTDDLVVIMQRLKREYPNLTLVYLSSRIYAGYASTTLNPEPYAYEGAFAVRRLVLDQVAGQAALNADPAQGEVKAPVLLWGPYLWGDGTTPRAADQLVWRRADLAGDGTHPSASGQQKVAALLLAFLKGDATAKGWFLKPE